MTIRVFLARVGTSALIVLSGVGLAAPPATAAVTDPWTFAGTVKSPARGEEAAILEGDLTAPANLPKQGLALARICLVKQGGQPKIDYRNCTGTAFDYMPSATRYLKDSLYANEGTGLYDLYVFAETQTGSGFVQLTGQAPVSFVAIVQETPRTIATPESVVAGRVVTASVVNDVTWSDGVTTTQPIAEGYPLVLQARNLGETGWTEIAFESPFTGTVSDSLEIRYLVNRTPSAIVLIKAIKPTTQVRITSLTADKTAVYGGAPLTLRFSAETLYDDSQWRPTPRTQASIQFAANSGGPWKTVTWAWINHGNGTKNLQATSTGYWRVRASNTTSKPLFVRVKRR